ncbi:UNVERIFIED_CONTAM: hypothetical protein FKN15_051087 [Acipenser sinensis]
MNLEALAYLNLDGNKFEQVPESLSDMASLLVIYMKCNYIRSLPDDRILGLTSLTKLDLRENPLTIRPGHWKVRVYI